MKPYHHYRRWRVSDLKVRTQGGGTAPLRMWRQILAGWLRRLGLLALLACACACTPAQRTVTCQSAHAVVHAAEELVHRVCDLDAGGEGD